MPDSISRFSQTVENYVKYRPTYPQILVEHLQDVCHLTDDATLADIGSGTGLLAEVFLRNGYRVFGVEPNPDMRRAGQHFLRDYPRFISVAAFAESTTLEPQSADMITVGQAFDWFDREKTRQEFVRILKPDGWVVLVWNIPQRNPPFLIAYEQLWKKYLDPQAANSTMSSDAFDESLKVWYSLGNIEFKSFDNAQVVNYEGLKGRVLSSSFAPTPEHPDYTTMLNELATMFRSYQVDGYVTIEYECRVCYGQLR